MKARRGLIAVLLTVGSVIAIPGSALAGPPNCDKGPWAPHSTTSFVIQATNSGLMDPAEAAATDEDGDGTVCVNTKKDPNTSRSYYTTAYDV